jgi:hypothetical protein
MEVSYLHFFFTAVGRSFSTLTHITRLEGFGGATALAKDNVS